MTERYRHIEGYPSGRILASATVDQLRGGAVPLFEVFVWGQPPHDRTRTYTIELPNETLAAQEGIRLFESEMEALNYGPAND